MTPQQARRILRDPLAYDRHPAAALALLALEGLAARNDLCRYFATERPAWNVEANQELLTACAETLGDEAVPILLTAVRRQPPALRRWSAALSLDRSINFEDALVRELLEDGLNGDAPANVAAAFVPLVAASDWRHWEPQLWRLLDSGPAAVRQQAAAALGARSSDALESGRERLQSKRANQRQTGALLLGACPAPEAAELLRAQLETESSNAVRNTLLELLGADAPGAGDPSAAAEIDAAAAERLLAEKRVAGAKAPQLTGITLENLPPLALRDGAPVDPQLTAWLLQRQSSVKQCLLHPEVVALAQSLAPEASREFLRQLLAAWIKKPDTKSVWVLALAAALGGDAVVADLTRVAKKAADGFKVKVGQWAVDALMTIDSDAALSAVLDIAEKMKDHSRQKFSRIGKHADAALRQCAARRGVTLDELADCCLPWLGFEPGAPRMVAAGPRRIAVTIGADYKLHLADADSGKAVKSMPKAAGEAAQAEFKATAKLLRDVVKSQTARLERGLVSGRGWSVCDFQRRVLAHPLLARMATTLVWTVVDDAGSICQEFRPLDDGSLTAQDDSPFELPNAGDAGDAARRRSIELPHPLRLSAERRAAWRTHLEDYELTPVFPQLDRLTFTPQGDEPLGVRCPRFAGRTVNIMSLVGRAERLGWRREPLPGYHAEAFCKRFPKGPVEAVEAQLLVGGDLNHFGNPQATAELGAIFWAPTESAAPSGAGALRVGDVDPIVFSETLYDVQRIADGL